MLNIEPVKIDGKIIENLFQFKVSKNWTIKFALHPSEDKLCPWDGHLLQILHRESIDLYWATIEPFNDENWLIYEIKFPSHVQKAVRDLLRHYGYEWPKANALIKEDIANLVHSAYSRLEQIVAKQANNLPYQTMKMIAKTEYQMLLNSPKYRLYKAKIDPLHAEQYEEYYAHVMGE